MAKKKNNKKEKWHLVLRWIIVILVIVVVGYQFYLGAIFKTIGIPGIFIIEFEVPTPPKPTPPKPTTPKSTPPKSKLPEGLVIFNAYEWYEQGVSGKKEIVCKPQAELNVELRKVSVSMTDPTVEQRLTYSKPQNDALEIKYKFSSGTEIGVHFLVHGFRKDPTNFVHLKEYEEGYILLRVKPMDIDDANNDDANNTDDYPAVSFGLKLRQGDTWFWDETHHSCSNANLHEQSGWRDIRLPIKPYSDQMRIVSSTVSEPLRLEQLLMIFGDTYASPRRSHFWLNAIVLVKKEMEPD